MEFMLGCNYWASHAGIDMWKNWDEDVVRRDLKLLSENGINILDISQTVVSDYFNMMMIVDTQKMDIDFLTFVDEITKIGEDKGVQVRCQREDIFDKMHRI